MPPSPPKPGCGTAPGRIQHTVLADFRFTVRRSRSFASPLVVPEPTAERTLGYTPDPDDPLSSAFGSLLSDVTG
jgi:hypothetical protein